ncbi:hypothetical protein EYC80_004354 [Monilinia laxa]|uniref:Uncharacterized protein n=1 Tax=Monilinia laxa TaxID=61186 RepID=A0A5N6KN51_MONLA|nr:hypothetical protein EYC80_004354 [Monilinia laxa]
MQSISKRWRDGYPIVLQFINYLLKNHLVFEEETQTQFTTTFPFFYSLLRILLSLRKVSIQTQYKLAQPTHPSTPSSSFWSRLASYNTVCAGAILFNHSQFKHLRTSDIIR